MLFNKMLFKSEIRFGGGFDFWVVCTIVIKMAACPFYHNALRT